jgi:hypothetical protein
MEKLVEVLGAIKEAVDWKTLLGVLLVIAGVLAGLYFGIWWAFIGGIIAFIEAIQAEPVLAKSVAYAIARVFFASLIGWGAFMALVFPGARLLK